MKTRHIRLVSVSGCQENLVDLDTSGVLIFPEFKEKEDFFFSEIATQESPES